MVSNFNVVMMYAIGILEILLPLTVLIIVYRNRKLLISSIIAGFACYFAITSMIVNGILSMILMSIGDIYYFSNHKIIGLLIESAMTSLLMTPAFYLILSKLRKGKWSLYDAAVISVSYWLVPLFQNAAIMISQGSVARYANSGRLEELVNEEYTIDALNSLVSTLGEISVWEMIGQFFTVLVSQTVILAIAVCLGFMVYYAVKRGRKSILLISIIVNFIYMMLMYGSEKIIGYWGSFAVTVALGIGAVCFIQRFLQFYRRQQAELIRRRQEFKAEQRARNQAEREAKQAAENQNQE